MHDLLQHCPRLTHLSVTGVQAFLREDITAFCREAPSGKHSHFWPHLPPSLISPLVSPISPFHYPSSLSLFTFFHTNVIRISTTSSNLTKFN